MVAFQEHNVMLPDAPMLGKREGLALLETAECDAARHALVNKDTHIMNLVVPASVTHVSDSFITALFTDIVIALDTKKPNGLFKIYRKIEGSDWQSGRIGSMTDFLYARVKLSRPHGFVEDAERREAKLFGEMRHDIFGVPHLYFGSGKNLNPIKPIRIEQKSTKPSAEAGCDA